MKKVEYVEMVEKMNTYGVTVAHGPKIEFTLEIKAHGMSGVKFFILQTMVKNGGIITHISEMDRFSMADRSEKSCTSRVFQIGELCEVSVTRLD